MTSGADALKTLMGQLWPITLDIWLVTKPNSGGHAPGYAPMLAATPTKAVGMHVCAHSSSAIPRIGAPTPCTCESPAEHPAMGTGATEEGCKILQEVEKAREVKVRVCEWEYVCLLCVLCWCCVCV